MSTDEKSGQTENNVGRDALSGGEKGEGKERGYKLVIWTTGGTKEDKARLSETLPPGWSISWRDARDARDARDTQRGFCDTRDSLRDTKRDA